VCSSTKKGYGGVEIKLHVFVILPPKVKGKVKLTLCLTKYYSIKTYPLLN
jgi:hypothetical protein